MKKLLYILAAVAAVTGCTSKDVPDPGFTVTPKNSTVALGDTAIFYLTGNPYNITFYAGDSAHRYEYRKRTSAPGTPQLQFTSYRQSGSQSNSLALLISKDFDGQYDSAGVYNPNTHWTDITERATLSTGSNNTPSGVVDLADFVNDGKPVYIAFKYTGQKSSSAQRTWTIPAFTVTNLLEDGNTKMPVAASVADAAFAVVAMKNPKVKWVVSATNLKVTGGAANSDEAESWVITKALTMNRAIPDVGVSVKNISSNTISSYYNIYKTAGTYKAVFEASNTTVYESKSVYKEVVITVTP